MKFSSSSLNTGKQAVIVGQVPGETLAEALANQKPEFGQDDTVQHLFLWDDCVSCAVQMSIADWCSRDCSTSIITSRTVRWVVASRARSQTCCRWLVPMGRHAWQEGRLLPSVRALLRSVFLIARVAGTPVRCYHNIPRSQLSE